MKPISTLLLGTVLLVALGVFAWSSFYKNRPRSMAEEIIFLVDEERRRTPGGFPKFFPVSRILAEKLPDHGPDAVREVFEGRIKRESRRERDGCAHSRIVVDANGNWFSTFDMQITMRWERCEGRMPAFWADAAYIGL